MLAYIFVCLCIYVCTWISIHTVALKILIWEGKTIKQHSKCENV